LLREVVHEEHLDTDQPEITFRDRVGKINPDLTIGVDVADVAALCANDGLSSRGMSLHGAGFIVMPQQAEHLGLGKRPGLEKHIRAYRNGRDLTAHPRGVMVIDLFGLSEAEVRKRFPEVYQHLLTTVKPERDRNNRESYRANWWIFGEPRSELRPALAGLDRYIVTVETMHHRILQFLPIEILPDNMLVCIADRGGYALGVLSSRIHVVWALRAGGWLGMGNDPRYSKSKVFDPFPFPAPGDLLTTQIRSVAEELDAFRKQRQKEHPSLTLTQIYNVLEKLKARDVRHTPLIPAQAGIQGPHEENSGSPPARGRAEEGLVPEFTADEQRIKDEGLILILKELHEKLDRLVFEAYGWPQTLTDEQILEKLVALNHERAAEERRGHVRWLRPDYQIPRFGKDIDKMAAKEEGAQIAADLGLPEPAARKPSFPNDAVAQTAAVFALLASAKGPTTADAIAAAFRRTRSLNSTIADVLASLARLGHVVTRDGKTFEIRKAA
jgi:hypothetical protein